ncbi:MAG TPA: hypothetical protein VL574_00835 [Stellaceae bacterium]|jgi:hypothetical protein|nr:hypothetical protein [Stellaceae bacterium]
MRGLMILGVILILAGLVALVFNVIPFHHQEEVAKIGPIHATTDKQENFVIPPYAAIIAIVAGGALVFAGRRRV